MSKGITLKGDAAKAFINAVTNTPPKTEDDELAQVAVAIHLAMKSNDMPSAVALLKEVRRNAPPKVPA